ncbi:hypothetical protein HEO20_024220, partial [Escherichia coli]|nr:hypothetical protein [Escherichia coli]
MNTSHVRVVTHMCGFLVWLYSLSMLPPMVVALFYKEKSLFVFFITFVIFFCIGGGALMNPLMILVKIIKLRWI